MFHSVEGGWGGRGAGGEGREGGVVSVSLYAPGDGIFIDSGLGGVAQ